MGPVTWEMCDRDVAGTIDRQVVGYKCPFSWWELRDDWLSMHYDLMTFADGETLLNLLPAYLRLAVRGDPSGLVACSSVVDRLAVVRGSDSVDLELLSLAQLLVIADCLKHILSRDDVFEDEAFNLAMDERYSSPIREALQHVREAIAKADEASE